MANWIKHQQTETGIRIEWGNNAIEVTKSLELVLFVRSSEGNWVSMSREFSTPTFSIILNGVEADCLAWQAQPEVQEINDEHGRGQRYTFAAKDVESLEKPVYAKIHFDFHENYPLSCLNWAEYSVTEGQYHIDGVYQNRLRVNPRFINRNWNSLNLHSVQGGGCVRQRWIKPIYEDTNLVNNTGVEPPGYGGGLPFVDLWCPGQGIAIGVPQYEYNIFKLPVQNTGGWNAIARIFWEPNKDLSPTSPYTGFKCMLATHTGDFYGPVQEFGQYIKDQGTAFPYEQDGSAHEALWCTWGYHRDITMDQTKAILPYLRKLGIKWIDLDDRWFNNVGDWMPRTDIYPEGEKTIKEFVQYLHKEGFLVRLWLMPGEADGNADLGKWSRHHPFRARNIELAKHPFHAPSEFYRQHPDCVVTDEKNEPVVTKRGNYYTCPAVDYVQDHWRKLAKKFIAEWGFDGFKIDAINICPPCHNPAHHHKDPMEAPRTYGNIMKTLYETAKSLKPDACIEICPCGVPPTVQWMNYQNQPITGDPLNSEETRKVVKFFKAFYGPHMPVATDHVEITDDGYDFATHVGCGGVTSTRFTLIGRDGAQRVEKDYFYWDHDDPYVARKERHWKKWHDLYEEKQLSKGEYQNLYDVIFDKPECHAIAKDGKMYYAFFAKEYQGTLELRGLGAGKYQVLDYANGRKMGMVSGPVAKLKTSFKQYLLLEATPAAAVSGKAVAKKVVAKKTVAKKARKVQKKPAARKAGSKRK